MTKTLPTIINSQSFARLRILLQISIVNIVLAELKIDVNEDISADIITASISPLAPSGIKSIINFGYAKFEQPFSLPQYFLHTAGSAQATSSF